MSIYLAVAAYLFSAAWVDVKGTAGLKKGVCLCSIFVLSIFIGLRDETGTDWLFYEDHYTNLANGITWENYNFDIGYEGIARLFAALGVNYNFFLFAYTAAVLSIFSLALSRLANPNFALLLFFLNYLVMLMGTLRQFAALAFVLVAVLLINERRRFAGLLNIILAGIFHKSAILMLIFSNAPLVKDLFTPKKLLIAVGFVIFLGLNGQFLFDVAMGVFSFSELITSKIVDYFVSDSALPIFYVEDKSTVFLMFAKRFAVLAIMVYLLTRHRDNSILVCSVKMYAVGVLLFSVLYSVFPAIAVRLGIYFTVFEVIGMASFRVRSLSELAVLVMFVGLCFYNFYGLLTGIDSDLLLPFKGVFINEDYERVLR
jgi:hypothetical protein